MVSHQYASRAQFIVVLGNQSQCPTMCKCAVGVTNRLNSYRWLRGQRKWEINEKEAEVVRRIHYLYLKEGEGEYLF
jgi:hypothetical protein